MSRAASRIASRAAGMARFACSGSRAWSSWRAARMTAARASPIGGCSAAGAFPTALALGRLAFGAERRGQVLGELRTTRHHLGGATLGVAGVRRLALRQVFGRLVHGLRRMGAEMIGGLEGRIRAAIAQRPDAIAELAQGTAERDGLAADRLLRLDVTAEHRLQSLAKLSLAAYQLLRGRDMPRFQGQLGIRGRGGRLGPGGFRCRSWLRRPGGELIEGFGRAVAGFGHGGGGRPPGPVAIVVALGGPLGELGGALDPSRGLARVLQGNACQLGGDGLLADRGLRRV